MTKDMTIGKPSTLIINFFIPLFLGNCFQQVYNLADTIIVGKGISDDALAAVGSTGSLCFLIFGFIIGLTSGISILISQAFGAKDEAALRKVITMSILVCSIASLLITVISLLGAKSLLILLQTPQNIMKDALDYMQIILAGLIATVAYNYCSGLLRALGDSKTPLIAMIVSSVINVVLDIVAVVYLHWGVEGAAYATVFAQICSVIFCYLRIRKIEIVHIHKKDWNLDVKLIIRLLVIGIPVGFMNSVTAVGCMILQYFVNGMGSAYTAAYSAGIKIFSFTEQPGTTLGITMTTFVGQNYGAKKMDRLKNGIKFSLLLSLLLNISIGLVEIFFPQQLAGLMLSEPETISLVGQFLPAGGFCLWILGFLFIFRGACQGMGYTMVPMLSGFLELALRVCVILLLSATWGFFGVAVSEVSAWIGAELMLMIYFFILIRKNLKPAVGVS